MARKVKKWIQKVVKRKGRVRAYLKRIYGSKAFTKNGKIKLEYLHKAKERALKAGNKSLVSAINLAIRLKKMKRR